MGMVVRTNTMANNAFRQLGINNTAVAKSLEKLSSGYRINRAGDDAAGLAISERMKAQIKGLDAASSNSQDGISLVQTAEGALTEVHSMLNRMVELATKAANGVYTPNQRSNYADEVDQLQKEIDRIADSTNFNSLNLIDGSLAGPKVTATAGTAGGGAGTKATFSVDLAGITGVETGKTYKLAFAGDEVEGVATAGTDAAALATSFDGKTVTIGGTAYKVTTAGTKLNLEAAAVGTQTEVTTTPTIKDGATAPTTPAGGTVTAPSGWTDGTAAGAAQVDGKVELDFTGMTGDKVIGGKMTLGGTEYTFVETGKGSGAAGAAGANEIAVNLADTDAAVVAAINAKGIANVTTAASTVTFTNTGNLPAPTASTEGIGGLTLQVGDTYDNFNKLTVSVNDMHAAKLGVGATDIDITTQVGAGAAIDKINTAIDSVSKTRSGLGAIQNRLEHTINNLDTTSENLSSAHSRIRDTDMAKEMMEYTKMTILTQSAQAMLAQANQQPQAILQLLQ